MSEEPGAEVGDAPSTREAESTMHIHRPKSLHGARELLTEIAIIVVGITIALVAEQAIDALHWRHKVAEAARAMRLELRDDDGPQSYVRVATEGCFARRLDAIEAAIEAGRPRREIDILADGYAPPLRTWDSQAWTAVLASDVGSHVSAEQMIDWSKPYREMSSLQTVNNQEHADLVGLQSARRGAEGISDADADVLLAATQRLRDDNLLMSHASRTLLFGLGKFGMSLAPEQQRRLLTQLRARYGACVVAPSTGGFDPNDQLAAPG